jgi:hypothetical protein
VNTEDRKVDPPIWPRPAHVAAMKRLDSYIGRLYRDDHDMIHVPVALEEIRGMIADVVQRLDRVEQSLQHNRHYGVPDIPQCTCHEPSGVSGCQQHMPVKLRAPAGSAHGAPDFREDSPRTVCGSCGGPPMPQHHPNGQARHSPASVATHPFWCNTHNEPATFRCRELGHDVIDRSAP